MSSFLVVCHSIAVLLAGGGWNFHVDFRRVDIVGDDIKLRTDRSQPELLSIFIEADYRALILQNSLLSSLGLAMLAHMGACAVSLQAAVDD